MILPILGLGVTSFIIAWLATLAMIRIAPRFGLIDKPGGRKIHAAAKPLGGGVAIFLGIALPTLAGLAYVNLAQPPTRATKTIEVLHPEATGQNGKTIWSLKLLTVPDRQNDLFAYWQGARSQTLMALAFVFATLAMHVLGLMDDRRPRGPFFKLVAQLIFSTALVIGFNLRALTALDHLGLGRAPSVIVTVLWITAITNAFNFLDNMDGLGAGVAAVCATAFLVTALSIQQW